MHIVQHTVYWQASKGHKSDFHWQSNTFLWFDFQTPRGLLIKEKVYGSNVQLL